MEIKVLCQHDDQIRICTDIHPAELMKAENMKNLLEEINKAIPSTTSKKWQMDLSHIVRGPVRCIRTNFWHYDFYC